MYSNNQTMDGSVYINMIYAPCHKKQKETQVLHPKAELHCKESSSHNVVGDF